MNKTYTHIDQLPLTLDANDIARTLGISRANAYNLFHTEGFPTLHIGKRMMCSKDRFTEWMDRQSGVTQNQPGRTA